MVVVWKKRAAMTITDIVKTYIYYYADYLPYANDYSDKNENVISWWIVPGSFEDD